MTEKLINEYAAYRAAGGRLPLADSGKRTYYDTGALRETGGKGRCDLLPLKEITGALNDDNMVLDWLDTYVRDGNYAALHAALQKFIDAAYGGDAATAMLEASHQFEDGARKYADRNWEKGIPQHCYIDSAVRHYLKWLRDDTDEHHDRAFLFNILAALWNHVHHPELTDLPFADHDKHYVLQCKCDAYCDGKCEQCADECACDSPKKHQQANACVCCGGPTDSPGVICDYCKEMD